MFTNSIKYNNILYLKIRIFVMPNEKMRHSAKVASISIAKLHGYGRIALILVELHLGLKKEMVELHSGKKQVGIELHLDSKKYFNQIIMNLKELNV